MQHRIVLRTLLIAGSLTGIAACSETPTSSNAVDHLTAHMNSQAAAVISSAPTALVQSVRQATARFHSTTQATKAGYVSDPICVQSPLGAMGYHWLNRPLIDRVFDPQSPEVVLYEPGPSGTRTLVALEYIVLNVGQARPSFGGQLFDIGGVPPLTAGGIAHWSLHVWMYRDNPAGMFNRFNTAVSCTP